MAIAITIIYPISKYQFHSAHLRRFSKFIYNTPLYREHVSKDFSEIRSLNKIMKSWKKWKTEYFMELKEGGTPSMSESTRCSCSWVSFVVLRPNLPYSFNAGASRTIVRNRLNRGLFKSLERQNWLYFAGLLTKYNNPAKTWKFDFFPQHAWKLADFKNGCMAPREYGCMVFSNTFLV